MILKNLSGVARISFLYRFVNSDANKTTPHCFEVLASGKSLFRKRIRSNRKEQFFKAGAKFSWLERLPVTQESAGSSTVAPAMLVLDFFGNSALPSALITRREF